VLLTRRILAAWQRWSEAEDRDQAARYLSLEAGEVITLQQLECNLAAAGPSPGWFEHPPIEKSCSYYLYRVRAGVCERLTAGLTYYRSEVPMLARLVHPARWGGQACLEAALERLALPEPPPPAPQPFVSRDEKVEQLGHLLDDQGIDLSRPVPLTVAARMAGRFGWQIPTAGQRISDVRRARGIASPARPFAPSNHKEEAMENDNGASPAVSPPAEALMVAEPRRRVRPATAPEGERLEKLTAFIAERGLRVGERWSDEQHHAAAEALSVSHHTIRGYLTALREQQGIVVPPNPGPPTGSWLAIRRIEETLERSLDSLRVGMKDLDRRISEIGANGVSEPTGKGEVAWDLRTEVGCLQVQIDAIRDELMALRCAEAQDHAEAPPAAIPIANVLLAWGVEGVEPPELRPHVLALARQALRESEHE
jgi:hypothetical protein